MAGDVRSGTATVLFTDLVGSTDLLARLGETAFDAVRREHFGALRGVIEAHQGNEVKTLGDGILAVFTSASEALAAAVAMQQAAHRQSERTALPISVRVGLALGDISFEEGDIFGTPVVEAARLVGLARGGQILITALVRGVAGARSSVPFTDIGSLDLKGVGPVACCSVDWDPVPSNELPLPPFMTGTGRVFVGRTEELGRLEELWKETTTGGLRVALIAGEPGIGKTRLAAELAAVAHSEGAAVLAGRCDEDLGMPFQPFVEALRQFVRTSPGPGARLGRFSGDLVRVLPELEDLAADLSPPLRSDPETERFRLFEAVVAWLSAVSAEKPTLLVLDDLQWATQPTLLLLRHVTRTSEPVRLLVVGTYRDTDLPAGHPLTDLLADLRRQDGVERFTLEGLDESAVGEYLEAAAGHRLEVGDRELPGVIRVETEGNPFFVGEVLRHLAETGALVQDEGRWTAAIAVKEMGIPEGVREVVGRRLSRLAEPTRRTLSAAAVAGPEFDVAMVEAVAGIDRAAAIDALEEARAARLVTEIGGTLRVRFSHALVRATLYDGLSAARRGDLHRRVAEALETVHARALDDHLPALAHHFRAAGEAGRAGEYAVRAGRRALDQLAFSEALQYFSQALEVAGEDERLELMLLLGEAQQRAGDAAHRETLLAAAELARQRHDAAALARAAIANNRWFHAFSGWVDAERVAVVQDALSAIGNEDPGLRARLLAILATELSFGTDHDVRRRLSDEAVQLARRSGDSATLANVLARRWTVLPLESLPERQEELVEAQRLCDVLDDPMLAFWIAMWRGCQHQAMGQRAASDAAFDVSSRLARALGQPLCTWTVHYMLSTQSRIAGDLEHAEQLARRGLEEAAGIADAGHIYGANVFWIRYDQGRVGEMVEALQRAVARPPERRNPVTLPSLGVALCEVGRVDEAGSVFRELAADDFAMLPGNFLELYGLTLAAQCCAHLDALDQARFLYRALAPHGTLIASAGAGATGCVDHYVALLAARLGDLDEADSRFSSAAAVHERVGAPTLLARTRLEWAQLLRKRGEAGDAERSEVLLRQAVATARRLGLAGIDRRAAALLQS